MKNKYEKYLLSRFWFIQVDFGLRLLQARKIVLWGKPFRVRENVTRKKKKPKEAQMQCLAITVKLEGYIYGHNCVQQSINFQNIANLS